jgi:hypothetical protein
MKHKLVGLAVAGALLAGGYQGAQAQPVTPSSGGSNSTLWLFVSDASKSETFAVDTGQTVHSLLSTFTANANLKQISDSFNVSATSALTTFLTTNSGDTLNWAVEAGSFLGGVNSNTPGAQLGIASANSAAGANFASIQLSNLNGWMTPLNSDLGYVIFGNGGTTPAYTLGGSTYSWPNGTAGGQVWGGAPGGSAGGSTTLYGAVPGVAQTGFLPGASQTLYAVTGNGGSGTVQSYVLGTISLATLANGAALTLTSAAPVPLPAALWLLGGGLLGLAGVGRRRIAAAA